MTMKMMVSTVFGHHRCYKGEDSWPCMLLSSDSGGDLI